MAHTKNMKRLKQNYGLLFIPIILIMLISFLNMANASLISSSYNYHLLKQILWYSLGFGLIFFLTRLNLQKIFKYSFYFYLLGLGLLFLVLVFGHVINGAKAWFTFGFFSFQPSELMKLALALYLTKIISETKLPNWQAELKLIMKVLIITLIPSLLVFLEPDTGAIIFFFLIAFTLLFFAKISKWWFLLFLGLLAFFSLSFYLLYIFNQDLLIKLIGTSFFYRVERLLTFTSQNSYQLENALVVIGSAGLWGSGLGRVSLYIPEAPTEFIFAFNIGNFGLIAGVLILLLYFVLDLYLVYLVQKGNEEKIKLFLISFISIFFFQQIINIGMNLGLLPIIGIPLPFLSYGGSTIIIYFLFLGIIINFLNSSGYHLYR